MMPRASSTFNEQINKPRKDAFGNSIQKGSKNHRVSFIDKLDNKKDLVDLTEFKENESIVPRKKIKLMPIILILEKEVIDLEGQVVLI